MMATTADDILKRFRAAQQIKTPWESQFKEVLSYVAPHRQVFDQVAKGQDKSRPDLVFDSTAIHALDGFASNLQSSMFPPGKKWIRLKPGPVYKPEEQDEIGRRLEVNNDTMFSYLRTSNFDTEVSTSLTDLGIGVGALQLRKGTKEQPFHFTAINLAEIYLEEGPRGRVDGVYRRYKVAARNLEREWEDAQLPTVLQEKLKSKPDEEVEIVEATIPERYKRFNPKTETEEWVWGYRYMVVAEKDQVEIVNRLQLSTPWIVFRWQTLSGEVYSRGPAMKALADIKSLNKAKELLLKKASLDTFPPVTVTDEGVLNQENIRVVPAAFIPVESNGGPRGPSIAQFPIGGPLNLTQFVFDDLVAKINKAMYAEPLGPVDAPVKTATEIAYRQAELARRIGSAFGRLQYELVVPLVNRCLHILEELDLLPYSLDEFRVDGRVIGISYESPLAQAQNQEDWMAMVQYAQTNVALFGPQLGLAMTKVEAFAKKSAEKLGVDPEIVPTREEFELMKQALVQGIASGQAGAPSLPEAA